MEKYGKMRIKKLFWESSVFHKTISAWAKFYFFIPFTHFHFLNFNILWRSKTDFWKRKNLEKNDGKNGWIQAIELFIKKISIFRFYHQLKYNFCLISIQLNPPLIGYAMQVCYIVWLIFLYLLTFKSNLLCSCWRP